MKKKIIAFIEETFLCEYNHDFTETSDLFKTGMMDSFGYIQLIKFLKSELEIDFSEKEVLTDVLVSLQNILDFSENNKTTKFDEVA